MKRALVLGLMGVLVSAGYSTAKVEEPQVKSNPPKILIGAQEIVPVLLKEEKTTVKVWELPLERGRTQVRLKFYQVGDYWFSPPLKLVNGRFIPERPEEVVKPLTPEEREELLKGIRELERDGIKLGAKNPEFVVFFDPLCPFCKMAAEKGELEKLKDRAVFIPVSVHGQAGAVLSAYLLQKAKKKPLPLVAEEWFKKEVEACKKNLDRCVKEKEKLLSRGDLYEVEKAERLFRKLRLTAVPAFINLKTGEVKYGFKVQ